MLVLVRGEVHAPVEVNTTDERTNNCVSELHMHVPGAYSYAKPLKAVIV